ncbi:endonuclease/exonuclease/phosphatase family protein [Arthrobacter sp. JSM 101049]|uniref:endonuclease/exonuclease/phosphatase family protein n=1 Tax=Arthrobacter sp. JSM 101049 TaxID=929097 RepID=UPI00356B2803
MLVPLRSFDPEAAEQPLVGPVEAPDLHVMTLNIRRRMPAWRPPAADRWNRRRPLLRRLLTAEAPALLGLQEVMPDQSEQIRTMLGPDYARLGSGRSATRGGERCEVHADATRLLPESSRTWWLSARPDEPGSRSFGNLLPRLVVETRLRDLHTGLPLTVMVTQLDHLSRSSRAESARLLHERAAEIDGPTVLMGDFNDDAGSALHRTLADGTVLEDTFSLARQAIGIDCGTYTRYRAPRAEDRRLDWILVSPGTTVEAAGVNPVRFGGRAVSDHEPVHAVLRWEPAPPGAEGAGRA